MTDARSSQIRKLGDPRKHFWLAQRMAKAIGVDLAGKSRGGEIDQAEWAGMITKCRGCQWAEGCSTWLQDQDGSATAPNTCENAERFNGLKVQS
ncbi:DUF6455 family protein [Nereida sp. MMG025]|uniref:DUF6455 family protein n=1 Tax=Nereida sp. MMG025 TaxID=2909981 RepID=UPI001F2BC758|nr:DUF6455 family protein [Nereida sp. MMG025]MCF6444048.1 DUF6455 family protein [Nereida sp. MMG025]